MSTPQEARRLFSRIVRLRDQDINLIEASLLISAGQGNDTNVDLCYAQIQTLVSRAEAQLRASGITEPCLRPREAAAVISEVLFREEGFTGNSDDYYNPANSYLDRVLARRTGIPITLAVLYMEVANRAGLPLRGIGLPGHFVAGYWQHPLDKLPLFVVDAFNDGQLLSPEECASRVLAAYGADPDSAGEWMQPVSHRQIVVRVLNNLKHIYSALGEDKRLLRTLDMLLLVQPGSQRELTERGLLYYRMGLFVPALSDLRRSMRALPQGESAGMLPYYVRLLQRLVVAHN